MVGSGAGLHGLPWNPAEGKEGMQFPFRCQQCRGLCPLQGQALRLGGGLLAPLGSVQQWLVVGQSAVPMQEQQQQQGTQETLIRWLATARSALRGLNTFAS